MTLFGKLLLVLILVTGSILVVKNGIKAGGEKEDTDSMSSSEVSTQDEMNQEEDFKGSIFNLVSLGKDYICKFSSSNDTSLSSGTVYVSGSNIRGDFESLVKGGQENANFESHMISDGEFSYVWSSSMPIALKMKVDMQNNSEDESQNGMFDYNQEVDYKCSPWTRDPSVFVLPSTVTFTEIGV
ncbi:hypothetical protein IT397_00790 [Candidatus Nomurabacteria bacterium]|nr:hypothetical protein [Candidatus Nomurabacteria bacterium]